MIFDEIYSAYYRTLDKIIASAIDNSLDEEQLRRIVVENAFLESNLFIEDEIKNENWKVLDEDLGTVILKKPQNEITTLQKRFLKTVSYDKRYKLFCDVECCYDVEPFYNMEDILYFDRFHNGDDYDDPVYISNFNLLLEIIKESKIARVQYISNKGNKLDVIVHPRKIEYSKKSDMFKLITTKHIINIGSIINVERIDENVSGEYTPNKSQVIVEIYDERRALERCMIEFSVFEKITEKVDDNTYIMKLTYYSEDEMEILIRILSFGPYVKVLNPSNFVEMMKERIKLQLKL